VAATPIEMAGMAVVEDDAAAARQTGAEPVWPDEDQHGDFCFDA